MSLLRCELLPRLCPQLLPPTHWEDQIHLVSRPPPLLQFACVHNYLAEPSLRGIMLRVGCDIVTLLPFCVNHVVLPKGHFYIRSKPSALGFSIVVVFLLLHFFWVCVLFGVCVYIGLGWGRGSTVRGLGRVNGVRVGRCSSLCVILLLSCLDGAYFWVSVDVLWVAAHGACYTVRRLNGRSLRCLLYYVSSRSSLAVSGTAMFSCRIMCCGWESRLRRGNCSWMN